MLIALALAFVEPPVERWKNLEGDYGQFTDLVDEQGPGGFLRDYTDRQPDYPTHLSAHPPGIVLVLWAEEQIGLGGTAGQVGTEMVGVGAAVIAVLVAVRALAGERWARAAAPFLVIAPAAVWHTNGDVVFGAHRPRRGSPCWPSPAATGAGRRTGALAVGGVLLGGALLFSQGLAVMALPAVADPRGTTAGCAWRWSLVGRRRWPRSPSPCCGASRRLASLGATKKVYDLQPRPGPSLRLLRGGQPGRVRRRHRSRDRGRRCPGSGPGRCGCSPAVVSPRCSPPT